VTPVDLDGKMCRLREMTADDLDALHSLYGNSDVCRHLSFTPRTLSQCESIIGQAVADAGDDPRQVYMLAVASRETGELIGVARLGRGEWMSGQFGLAVRPDQQHHGVGLEALRLLLRLGFSELGLHRIWGARAPMNSASGRLMEAAGMKEDGRIRSHVLRHGIWSDSLTASILESEF
jgi:ribosomal-protein-alanine N-acetyltransferase